MNPTALELERKAREAKSLYAAGEVDYATMRTAAEAYINFCNERAAALAAKHGMKPKLMSVKAWLR
jgi:hypothetical protein